MKILPFVMCMSCGFESILKVLAVSPTSNVLAEYKDQGLLNTLIYHS